VRVQEAGDHGAPAEPDRRPGREAADLIVEPGDPAPPDAQAVRQRPVRIHREDGGVADDKVEQHLADYSARQAAKASAAAAAGTRSDSRRNA